MADAAEKIETPIAPTMRRFQMPDIDHHASWLFPRLRQAYPHLNDASMLSFLRSYIYDNMSLFLHQENAVALVQTANVHSLSGKSILWERFVWCQDPKNAQQQLDASFFYVEMARWAKNQNIETGIVAELTDVPLEMIKQRVGRVFARQQQFVRF